MIYGYIRVSTDKQTCKNQKIAIRAYCKAHRMHNIQWVAETISGTKKPAKRKLGSLLDGVEAGDTIICTELSRLERRRTAQTGFKTVYGSCSSPEFYIRKTRCFIYRQ